MNGRRDPADVRRPSSDPARFVIQYTDDGELVDRCALTDAFNELRSSKPIVLLLYVHGWKHNADPGDSDLANFDSLLVKAKRDLISRGDHRQVIGVYVGWNGKSWPYPGVRELTFWGRKRSADQVSQSGALGRLLGAIKNIRAQRLRDADEPRSPQDLTLYVGHSFGARLLFAAAAPVVIEEIQSAHPGNVGLTYKEIQGPATLMVLLNPAFEAGRYIAFDSQRRFQEQFDRAQQPVILTISTTNDWATEWAYPAGQWFGLVRSPLQRTTLGNYSPFVTHTLDSEPSGQAGAGQARAWYDQYCLSQLCLQRIKGDVQPGNPFIVASTNGSVIDGHNGIWAPKFVEWLWSFAQKAADRQAIPAPDVSHLRATDHVAWIHRGRRTAAFTTPSIAGSPSRTYTVAVDARDNERLTDARVEVRQGCGWTRLDTPVIVDEGRRAKVEVHTARSQSCSVILSAAVLRQK